MKRLPYVVLALASFAIGCGSASTSPSATAPTFTATLLPSNEVPAITGAEASGSGSATITFDVTKDAAGNITAGTVTFVVTLTGFPAGTPINIAHIHQAGAGVNGAVRISTTLSAGEVTLANGSGSFTRANISADAALLQAIINNPSGFYFNVHSSINPGGVARGQLTKVS
jgi:hypothetical protein